MLLIIAIVLVVYGCAIMFGTVTVFEKRSTRFYVGFGLLILSFALIVLMVRLPHG